MLGQDDVTGEKLWTYIMRLEWGDIEQVPCRDVHEEWKVLNALQLMQASRKAMLPPSKPPKLKLNITFPVLTDAESDLGYKSPQNGYKSPQSVTESPNVAAADQRRRRWKGSSEDGSDNGISSHNDSSDDGVLKTWSKGATPKKSSLKKSSHHSRTLGNLSESSLKDVRQHSRPPSHVS